MPRGLPSVLLVATSNRRRGAEVFTDQVATGLRSRGWSVNAVALTQVADAATVPLQPITSLRPEETGRLDVRIVRALRRHIREQRPGVIIAMGGPTLRYAVLSNLLGPSRVVYYAIGEPRYWLRSKLAHYWNRALLNRVDHVLAVSRMTAEQLVDIAPSLADRVTVAYTGVDHRYFEMRESGPEDAEYDVLKVCWVGSMSAEKDPLLALQGVAGVTRARLRFVGDGPLRSQLEAGVAELGLEGRVDLVGAVDDVRPHLAWADVILLTSRTEGLPGVVLESAAAATPAIGVAVGGMAEAIQDGVTGFVVDRDPTSVSAALSELHADRSLLESMGVAARRRALREFRIEFAVDRIAVALEELASAPTSP